MAESQIVRILIDRDQFSLPEAKEWLRSTRQAVINGEDPEELLEEIGLEPDYIMELL